MLYWIYLIVAGLFEIGWPLGLKMAQEGEGNRSMMGVAIAVISIACSGFLLFLAQREIPMGTAYAVWSGIGAAGTFIVGVLFFGDASILARWIGVALIIAGVVTLKVASINT